MPRFRISCVFFLLNSFSSAWLLAPSLRLRLRWVASASPGDPRVKAPPFLRWRGVASASSGDPPVKPGLEMSPLGKKPARRGAAPAQNKAFWVEPGVIQV